jgi:DNA-binding NarL/FixJ family response regulator
MPITVGIVEDFAMWREAVAKLLGETPDIAVVGTASTLAEARELLRRERPNVVVLDLLLGAEDSLVLVRETHEFAPQTRWVVLSENVRPVIVHEALRLGVQAMLGKSTDNCRRVKDAVHAVATGGEFFSQEAAAAMAHMLRHQHALRLSEQEEVVLEGLAEGKSLKEIAIALAVESGTVAKYLARIREKLHIDPGASVVTVLQSAYRVGLLLRRT